MTIYAQEYLLWKEKFIDLRIGHETKDKELIKYAETQKNWTLKEEAKENEGCIRENS